MLPERKTRDASNLGALFDSTSDITREWWGMPSFSMADATPLRRIVVSFATDADIAKFAETTGLRITPKTDSVWFPDQGRLRGEFYYDGPPTSSRYPVCIPSKGRADIQTTGKLLDRLGVSYRFFR